MYQKILLFLLCLLPALATHAQRMESFDRLNDEGYNYWFYTPDTLLAANDSAAKKPLVVFLHGQSICGTRINDVLRYGTLDAIRRGYQLDAYVVAPQNPGGRWAPSKVLDLVDWAIANHEVDSCRVYVLGMSLGGFGTINVAAAYPERFAAAMALCGGGNNPSYENLHKIPLWILHGTADRKVKIRESQEVVKGMQQLAKPERMMFTRLKGQNHSILARIFYMPKTYQWLFAHSLADSARTMNRDYSITVADLQTAYHDLHSPTWEQVANVNHMTAPQPIDSRSARQAADDTNAQYYKVRKGDNLSKIAKRHHTSVRRLCQLNGIKETKVLQIGQRLRVR